MELLNYNKCECVFTNLVEMKKKSVHLICEVIYKLGALRTFCVVTIMIWFNCEKILHSRDKRNECI